MILDYVPLTNSYLIKVPREDATTVQALIREHGLDLSVTASNAQTAVLFTHDSYAAASFANYATPAAKQALGGILDEIEASFAKHSGAHIKCPPGRELWDFQRADIEYALRRQNTLIGDQPGLGKTPVAICFANEISAKRVLVICPASIRIQWVNRIREWTTMPWPVTVHAVLNARHGIHPLAQWNVVSYDLARTRAIQKAIVAGTYDLLILDEAHYCKTIDAGRTRAIFGGGTDPDLVPITSRCGAILALTGTPLPNRPREAYTLARGLCFDAIDWASEDHFRDRYNPSLKVERFDPDILKTSIYIDERTGRHAELQNRLRAHFMVRHLKREVMPQLKLPVYDLISVEETGAVKQALAAESLLDIDPENLEGADAEILGHIAVVRRMMGIALAPQVADYIDMLIDGGEIKLVLFAWHIEVLNILEKRLAKHGIVRIDGSTSASKKQYLVDEFRTNSDINVALGNVLSMGTGTDGLQDVAYHGLIAEPSWTPGENIQCFDRLDRGGQVRTVQGDIFVAPGSFAERVLASSLRKLQTIDKALDRRFGT